MTTEDTLGRWSPGATAVSGAIHAAVVLAIVYQLSPWQADSTAGNEPPAIEVSIVQPEVPPSPPSLSLPRTPDLASVLPVPQSDPAPPPPPEIDVVPRLSASNIPQLVPPPTPSAPELPRPPSPPPTPSEPEKAGPDLATAHTPPAPKLALAPAPPAPPQKRADYLLQVIRALSRSPYIPHVRLETAPGVVVMRLTVGSDGRLREAQLVRSSGFASLDNGMMEAVRRAAPFPPPPDGADDYTVTVPIRFAPLETSRAR